MSAYTTSKTGAGRSSVIVPDYFIPQFNLGLQAVVTGTATYSIQFTMDDTSAASFDASTATWTTMAAPFSAATATQAGAFTTPVRGICINVASGAGTVALTIVQAGNK